MKAAVLAVCTALVIAAGAGAYLYWQAAEPVNIDPEVTVDVPPGATPRRVASLLQEKGVVRSRRLLVTLARIKGMDRKIRHGSHSFSGPMDVHQVLAELVSSPKPTIRLTIPEGLTYREIAALIESKDLAPAADYEKAVCAPAFLARTGASAEANCAEGHLFPDTYNLAPGMSAAEIADLQLRGFRDALGPALAEAVARLESADATAAAEERNRILTLASIIEKETGRGEERTLIAAVLHNRLRRGMQLQTDPTVIYGLLAAGKPWDGNLTRAHLEEPGPYNTYTIAALPPGPICNPGRASVEAAVRPADNDYLYFVARGDGSHEFSRTYADHRRAVRKYQLR